MLRSHLAIQRKVEALMTEPLRESNVNLECDIFVEEVEYALRHLKCNRSRGLDNVSPEHVKFSGPQLIQVLALSNLQPNLSTRTH